MFFFSLFLNFKECSYISATRCPIEMGFVSKCSILNGQLIDVKNSKLNIANMWLIPLDRVTNVISQGSNIIMKPSPCTCQIQSVVSFKLKKVKFQSSSQCLDIAWKCIQMSTNKPSIGPVALETTCTFCENLDKISAFLC